MPVHDIQVKGADELEAAMNGLPWEVLITVAGPGCGRAARIIAKALIASINVKTGNLQKSVRAVRIDDYIQGIKVPGGKAIVKYGGYDHRTNAPHAHLIEFGTVKMPAKNLLAKAVQANPEQQHQAFVDGMADAVARVVKNAANGKLSAAAQRVVNQSN